MHDLKLAGDIKKARRNRTDGMPFDGGDAATWRGFKAGESRERGLGEPKGRTKDMPVLRIADPYPCPRAKAGIRYSCFEDMDRGENT